MYLKRASGIESLMLAIKSRKRIGLRTLPYITPIHFYNRCCCFDFNSLLMVGQIGCKQSDQPLRELFGEICGQRGQTL